ncbi:PAS domain-containing protein [Xanthobacter agilis]|uniref:PAS domain-containing protein n=1 Tax=Xanthobacter agilis TaxID=47492 RepID=UPI00372C5BF3
MPEPAGLQLMEDERQAFALAQESLDDLLIDVVGEDGRLLWANERQNRAVGLPADLIAGLPIDALYTPDSADTVAALLRHAADGGHLPACELTLVGRGGRSLRTLAQPRYVTWHGRTALALTKMDFGAVGLKHQELEDDARLLGAIVRNATEAHWAIVFLEPVDTTQPKAEVIRQVFENQSVWRMCNTPMARLYELPDDMDLNSRDVRLQWPRSAANERFVNQIIDANYEIDDALSIDSRHDGTPVYIRNDVRAEIVDGFLRRLWGNCRDVTDQRQSETDSAERLGSLRRVFDAVPDAVIVLDGDGAVVIRNLAFVAAHGSGETMERRLALKVRKAMATGTTPDRGWRSLSTGGGALRLHWRQVPGTGDSLWNVLVVRPLDASAAKAGKMPADGPVRRRRNGAREAAET